MTNDGNSKSKAYRIRKIQRWYDAYARKIGLLKWDKLRDDQKKFVFNSYNRVIYKINRDLKSNLQELKEYLNDTYWPISDETRSVFFVELAIYSSHVSSRKDGCRKAILLLLYRAWTRGNSPITLKTIMQTYHAYYETNDDRLRYHDATLFVQKMAEEGWLTCENDYDTGHVSKAWLSDKNMEYIIADIVKRWNRMVK